MSEITALDKRVGQIEETLGQSGDKNTAVLKELQNRLNIIQDAIVQKNAKLTDKDHEIQRLAAENAQLRQMVQRLTSVIESAKADTLSDQLRSLDTQIGALAELTDLAHNGSAVQAAQAVARAEEVSSEQERKTVETPEEEPAKPAAAESKKPFPFGIDDRKWIRDVIDGAAKATMAVGAGAKGKGDQTRNVDAYGPEPTPVPQSRLAVIHGGDVAAEPTK